MRPELRPAIVQDARDGRVLMLAWMDDEALRLTRETGEAWFWSRSRERLWKKGETSGNTLAVQEVRDDCDGDALLVRVVPDGVACHTGSLSCFAPALWRTVVDRVRKRPDRSYVASLADAGIERAAQKLGEEAVEAAIAATARDGRLASEAADVLFHLYALLAVAGVDIAEVEAELDRRARDADRSCTIPPEPAIAKGGP
jgi:phosphoribosyl-AMP cyclohydrolase / phosphoribosyl-ATP pyrophosphohydrolase